LGTLNFKYFFCPSIGKTIPKEIIINASVINQTE